MLTCFLVLSAAMHHFYSGGGVKIMTVLHTFTRKRVYYLGIVTSSSSEQAAGMIHTQSINSSSVKGDEL